MNEPETIAERTIWAVDKDSRSFEIHLMLGKPYQIEAGNELWACPVAMVGLHGRFPDMHGGDSWQSLSLATLAIKRILSYFIDDGGKLFWDEGGGEMSIDELFSDTPIEVPISNGPLTDEQQSRIAVLTKEELQRIDDSLLNAARPEWRKVAFIVGNAMLEIQETIRNVPDIFYAERVKILVGDGRLLAQGDLDYMRFSEVKLPE